MPMGQRSSLPNLILLTFSLLTITASSQDCNVAVTVSPSTSVVPVPLDSTVHLNCTLKSSSDPLWSIDLPDDETAGRFQFDSQRRRLNARGLYELPSIIEAGMTTIRLLINGTAINNQTLIDCAGGPGESFLTKLMVFVPREQLLLVTEEKLNSVKLTWIQESSFRSLDNVMQTFFLIISYGSISQVISLNESSDYNFTSPEGAPPCEVYNFSVTATYNIIGVIYTGAGCSVPSQGLSLILPPSLPDINKVESSLKYSLIKKGGREIIFNVSFEEVSFCGQDPVVHVPVLNYTLVINNLSFGEHMHSVTPQADNLVILQDDMFYSFKLVIIAGAAGVVTSKINNHFYTTDVQTVSVQRVPDENMNAFVVQCHFIQGSDAQGCMVVFESNHKNLTKNITKRYHNNGITEAVVSITEPTSCYYGVHVFDIEYDGSVGTLAVPGEFVKNMNKDEPLCATKSQKTDRQTTTLVVVFAVAIVIIMVGVLLVVAVFSYTKFKPCSSECRHRINDKTCDSDDQIKQQTDPGHRAGDEARIQLHPPSDNVMKISDGIDVTLSGLAASKVFSATNKL